jgi:hypothetical protein
VQALSVAEEQPEQDDHRDWHPQQPQQNSASHRLLLVLAFAGETQLGRRSGGPRSQMPGENTRGIIGKNESLGKLRGSSGGAA